MVIKYFIEYILFKFIFIFANLLSWKATYYLGIILGKCVYFCLPYWKKITHNNLKFIYGSTLTQKEIIKMAKKVYENFCIAAVYFLREKKINKKNLDEFIEFQGLENLDKALSQKKGVIVISGHFGNWEVMVRGLCLKGYPIYALYRPQNNYFVDKCINNIRTSGGIKLIPRNKSIRKVFSCIKNNQIFYTMMDQNVIKNGIFVDFMGHRASTAIGTTMFALKTQACVLPIFSYRLNYKKYKIIIGEEILLEKTGIKEKDIEKTTTQFTKSIEEFIKKSPTEWLWLHPRWKTQ
ncbi:MAG: lysophospholipid acyltransferase family protein [bacterium]